MTKSANQGPFIYIRSMGEKIPVTPEQHRAFYQEVDRKRKYEQYHHRCVCPKAFIWSCDGDCDICEHYRSDTLSLDAANSEGGATLYDAAEVESLYHRADASFEDVIADRLLIEKLFNRLREITPYADRIIAMWQENYGISARRVAEALGIPQRTFAELMKRVRAELRKIRGF